MKRQIVVSGIAKDPSRPIVWDYRHEGPRFARTQGERHAVTVTAVRDLEPSPSDSIDQPHAV